MASSAERSAHPGGTSNDTAPNEPNGLLAVRLIGAMMVSQPRYTTERVFCGEAADTAPAPKYGRLPAGDWRWPA